MYKHHQTRFLLAICFIFGLACCIEASRSQPRGAEMIKWQIHSWDDLNEWPSMLAKGANWIKIDMHYMDTGFCMTQGVTDPNGCFVLLHDDPLPTVSYNTSDDVLTFIADPTYKHYFFNPDVTVYLALCFKSTPYDICGSAGAGFMAALTDFQAKTNVLKSKGANIEYIIDGTLYMPETCLIDKFRPWVSTWQGPPAEAFFSDNSSLGYDRIQVFDLPAYRTLIKEASIWNWGKFLTSGYPLLLWEPADESEISEMITLYLNWAQTYTGPDPLPEFRFAINIDPIQFQIYTGTTTKNVWRDLLSSNATQPKISWFDNLASDPALSFIMISNNNGKPFFSIGSADEFQGNFETTSPIPIPGLERPHSSVSATTITIGSSHLTCFAISEEAAFNPKADVHFLLLENGNSLRPLSQLSLSPSAYSFTQWVSKSAHDNQKPTIARLYVPLDTSQCSLFLQLLSIRSFSPIQVDQLGHQCVTRMNLTDPYSKSAPNIFSASLSLYSPSVRGNCITEGMLTFSSGGFVYASSVCYSSKLVVGKPKIFDVGYETTTSLAIDDDGQVHFHEAHSGGFCWNTEERNKQPEPVICDQTPVSTPNVLTYNYAPLKNWYQYLQSNNFAMLGVCQDQIFHGVYDQGRNPSISLTSLNGKIGIVEVHEGWKKTDVDLSLCGAPIAFSEAGGVVMDSWPLL